MERVSDKGVLIAHGDLGKSQDFENRLFRKAIEILDGSHPVKRGRWWLKTTWFAQMLLLVVCPLWVANKERQLSCHRKGEWTCQKRR